MCAGLVGRLLEYGKSMAVGRLLGIGRCGVAVFAEGWSLWLWAVAVVWSLLFCYIGRLLWFGCCRLVAMLVSWLRVGHFARLEKFLKAKNLTHGEVSAPCR